MNTSNKLTWLLLFSILFCFFSKSWGQTCIPKEGERYYLKIKTLNLREHPNKNSRIIKVLNEKKYSLIILSSDSIRNNYIFVKAIIDSTNNETKENYILEELFGWVSYDLVDWESDSWQFMIYSGLPEESEEVSEVEEIIDEEKFLRNGQSCKHNPSRLAYANWQYGRILFWQKKYLEAIEVLNDAIEVSTNNSVGYKLVSYYFRGLCKYNLDDNYGAISDFSKLIGQKNKYNSVFVCDWAFKYKNDYLKMEGVTCPIVDREELYSYLAICKSRLKNYDGALKDIQVMLTNNIKSGNAYYLRAQLNYNMKRYKSACIDASKAGELGINEAYEFISQYCK